MNWKPRAVPILLLCSCMLVLGGCNKEDKNKADNDKSSEETKAINEGEYSALLPFSVSDAGQKHAQMQTNLSDTLTIGTGLMELSKEYFSSKTYAFRGGKYLDYNTLDASADNSGLLGSSLSYTSDAADDPLCVSVGGGPITKKQNRISNGVTWRMVMNSVRKPN